MTAVRAESDVEKAPPSKMTVFAGQVAVAVVWPLAGLAACANGMA